MPAGFSCLHRFLTLGDLSDACAARKALKEKAAGRYAVGLSLRLPAQRPVLPHSVWCGTMVSKTLNGGL